MLINLRNALMTGKRLPYDAEVEYLESTGTQYINTGVYADNETAVELLGKYTQVFHDNAVISMDARNNQTRAFTIEMYNGRIYFSFSDTMTQNASLQSSWNQISASQNGLIVNSDSVSVSQAPAFQCEYPLFMFCYGRKGVPIIYGKWQIASCKIYQNGVLVRDYIPVRKKTVGYLYDRVSGKLFGNAGTGDFVVGPDVVPVEYIESHGTEYLNIPASGTPDEYFGIKGLVKITNTSQRNKAVWDTETNRQFGACGYDMSGASYVFASWVGAKNTSGGWFVSPGVLYPFEVSTLGKTLNGEFQSLPRNITSAFSTLRLFGKYGTAEYGGNASVAFGALTIADGTGNARNFYPVRVGTDATSWEGAMMDVPTRRIYRNAGRGAFGYGNDLKYPIPAE